MADPLPATPLRPAEVTLRGGDLPWRPVSPALTRVRLISLGIVLAPLLVATVVVGLLVTRWVLLGTLALVLVGAWLAWIIGRQVSAISWVELDEEIVIRKGRMFRSPGQRALRPAAVRRHPVRAAARAPTASRRARSTPPPRERRLPARAARRRGRGAAQPPRGPRRGAAGRPVTRTGRGALGGVAAAPPALTAAPGRRRDAGDPGLRGLAAVRQLPVLLRLR